MKFINTTTNDALNINIIDPKTGVDVIADILQLEYDHNLTLNDDYAYEGDADAIEFYKDLSAQYQTAYDLMHEIKESEDADKIAKLDEILEDAQGWETNDWAGYVIKDIQKII